MADLFDDLKKNCGEHQEEFVDGGVACCHVSSGIPCKFYRDGCSLIWITGEIPGLWSDEDRECVISSINRLHAEIALDDTTPSDAGYSISQKHYVAKSPIEFMQSLMNREMFIGFCIGNTIKYLMRANYKGQHDSDLNKARQYSWWASLAKEGKVVNPSDTVPDDWKTKVFLW